jgi:sodium-dependent dicarboxylate transporter 2/3/5
MNQSTMPPSVDNEHDEYPSHKLYGLFLGPIAALLLFLFPVPEGLEPAGWYTAAVGLWMAVWWITEAIPIAATALLPLVLFPLIGAGSIDEAASPYANPLIFLFLGGFLLALAMQRWDLHRRIALQTIRSIGTTPTAIIIGFMIASAFLSMWVSNTATAMMMMPIGLSVIKLVRTAEEETSSVGSHSFGALLMLAIAYSCSIGGIGTIIGTPPNALLVGFFDESYGLDIGFARWMLVGIPMVIVALPMAFGVLRWLFPFNLKEIPGGRSLIESKLRELGPMSNPERMVAWVFSLVALLWIIRPLLDDRIPGLSDAGIAMSGALLLFLLPVDFERGIFVLNWKWAERLPWGVLLLFGGGLSLAAAVSRTGLATWIGQAMTTAEALPLIMIITIVTATVVFLTELTSNTATAAAFMPIMASVAIGIGQNPLLLAVPAALAASCAFMLPVATPPNAIIYGSGELTIPQMARTGILLNLSCILLITILCYTVLFWFFGVEIGVIPSWAG